MNGWAALVGAPTQGHLGIPRVVQ